MLLARVVETLTSTSCLLHAYAVWVGFSARGCALRCADIETLHDSPYHDHCRPKRGSHFKESWGRKLWLASRSAVCRRLGACSRLFVFAGRASRLASLHPPGPLLPQRPRLTLPSTP